MIPRGARLAGALALSDPGAIAVAVGTAVSVLPVIIHEEVEGSSTLAVDSARSDDPTVARVIATTTHVFGVGYQQSEPAVIVYGVKAGTTTLRLFDGGSDEGTLTIHVVAQDP